MDTSFEAKVQWWNSSFVYVLCPLCEEIHRHHFNGCYEDALICHWPDMKFEYKVVFPFDQDTGECNFWIDKHRALFVAANVNPDSISQVDNYENLPESYHTIQNKMDWEKLSDTSTADEDPASQKIVMAMRAMASGNFNYVRDYLESPEEAAVFLNSVNNFGQTALHLAAGGQYSKITQLLLSKGARPDAQDRIRRTPLMEAALWGQFKNVDLLLQHEVTEDLAKAAKLAKDLPRNDKERSYRSRAGDKLCFHCGYERGVDRQEILLILSNLNDKNQGQSPTIQDIWSTDFAGTVDYQKALLAQAVYYTSSKSKTIGILRRGPEFPTVAAISGWSHRDSNSYNIISGQEYTKEVFRLCEATQFTLWVDDQLDKGIPGRYYACHVEKQLIAYFISQHAFPSSETENVVDDLVAMSLNEVSDEERRNREKDKQRTRDLLKLEKIKPPITFPVASIFISKEACDDCAKFCKHINKRFGTNITLVTRIPVRWE